MSELKRRIKSIERRLDAGGQGEEIIINPPRRMSETDVEYQARINEPDPPGYARETIKQGNVEMTLPARRAGVVL